MKTNINSDTRLYGVIGDPIAHSLSPVFQNYLMDQKNINALYIPLRITSNTLGDSLEILKNNFSGFNVTIPHKESILQYLDEISPTAAEYGAVNTVKVVDGRLIGYNTDGVGFRESIENSGVNPRGKNVLLLGAGGAAKVIASEIIKFGGNLTIANRNIDRGEHIGKELQNLYNVPVKIMELESIGIDFDAVINSTSVGMYPDIDKSPVDSNVLQSTRLVYDVIYNPFETKLLKLGNRSGAKTINGLPMLIYQGLKSFEIWTETLTTHGEKKKIYEMLEGRLC